MADSALMPSVVLSYAAPAGTRDGGGGEALAVRLGRCLLLLPGLWVPWAAFVAHVSPAGAIGVFCQMVWERQSESAMVLIVLAVGLASPAVLWAWCVRLLIHPAMPSLERRLALALAGAAAAATVFFSVFVMFMIAEAGGDPQWWQAAIGPAFYGLIGPWLLRRRRTPSATYLAPLAALETAYLGNAVMALLMFWDGHNVGWWVTAYLCGVAAADVAIHLIPRRARAGRG